MSYDFYQDGDWKEAIKAAIVALENGIPLPEWTKQEVLTELFRSIGLRRLTKRPKTPKGQQELKNSMNKVAVVAAVDAAASLGFKDYELFEKAWEVLNAQGILVESPESVRTRAHVNKAERENRNYRILFLLFQQEISKTHQRTLPHKTLPEGS